MAKKGNQKKGAADKRMSNRTMAEKAMVAKGTADGKAVYKEIDEKAARKETGRKAVNTGTAGKAQGRKEEQGEKAKARSWKIDFIMGIVIAVIGVPFFVTEYRIAGIVMVVIGAFCVISGLCQKVAKDEKGQEK